MTVSLIAVIEDEFGISIEIDDLSHFDSFQGIVEYLPRRGRLRRSGRRIVLKQGIDRKARVTKSYSAPVRKQDREDRKRNQR
jgi:hypothetical protein